MMYHFMLGFLGASAVTAAPSAPAVCGSPAVVVAASFFSSSCIMGASALIKFCGRVGNQFCKSANPDSVNLEIVEQRGHAVLNEIVDHGKVQRENENRDHNDCGRGPDFLPRRGSDFAHFGAYVVVEGTDPFRPGLDLVAEAATRCC